MTEEMNVPTLRFSEFDGLWSQNKTPIKILAGNAYKQQEYTDNGYLLIQGLHIQPDKIELEESPKYVAVDGSKHLKIGFGDIVLGLNRPITNNQLKACRFYLKEESVLYQRAGKLKFDTAKLGTEFLYQYLRTPVFMKQLDLELIGSDQPYIKSDLFQATKNIFPTIVEQQKIASFLSKVDEKITLLTEKKDKLTEYKKGVMQQLFNGKWEEQDGQLVFIPPTLRFKADDGREFPDWEEKKLGDVLTIGNGRDYKHLSDGDIPVFGTGGYMTSVDEYLYDGETVFIGRKGTINKPYMFNGKFWTVDTLFYTKDFKDILPKFVYAIFQKVNWSLYNEATGVPSLSKSTINRIRLNVPSLSEQEKITEFISSLDQKIDLVNKELEKAKEWKKGLLQQMFV
ncbi:TPA: restriction endonuclease subunit S [Vibrio parahaemolyticus]|nr:restriction endonuclease subunit S [Vibrio parahaemolyticus]